MIEYKILKNNEPFADGMSTLLERDEILEEWLDSNGFLNKYDEFNENEKGNLFVKINKDIYELQLI